MSIMSSYITLVYAQINLNNDLMFILMLICKILLM